MVAINSINKIEYLQRLCDSCRNEGESKAIVVEGANDKKALTSFGFEDVFSIAGRCLEDVVDQVKKLGYESVIILTDFDREGVKKSRTLKRFFQSNGIKVNSSIRKRLGLFNIHKIEELNSFIKLQKLLEDGYNSKTCSTYNKIFNRSRFLCRRSGRKF